MQPRILRAIFLATLGLCGAASASQCILPVPDGGDADPSPPNLVGTIQSVSPSQVVLRVAGVDQLKRVAVLPSTELFSVYGGGFEFHELRPGQHTLVWFIGCVAPKHGIPKVAVLEICSLAAEPCPG